MMVGDLQLYLPYNVKSLPHGGLIQIVVLVSGGGGQRNVNLFTCAQFC